MWMLRTEAQHVIRRGAAMNVKPAKSARTWADSEDAPEWSDAMSSRAGLAEGGKTGEWVTMRMVPELVESIAAGPIGELTQVTRRDRQATHRGELRQPVP